MAKDLNVEERVIFAGITNEVDSYYLTSKIFAFASSSEGFPNVVGEAMSAGLPVVAFDCIAGPSEMINDGETGYLVPLNNDDIFKERLTELMMNDYLRESLGKNGKLRISEFSIDLIGERYYNFIFE